MLWLVCICIAVVDGFNLDVDNPLIWGPKQVDDNDNINKQTTYFGYSVLLQKEDNSPTLLVGAPIANSSYMYNFAELNNTGTVFQCDITPSSRCQEYNFFTEADQYAVIGVHSYYKDKIYFDWRDAWVGGSLADNGPWICSHRFKLGIYNETGKRNLSSYDMYGMCQDNNGNYDEPLFNPSRSHIGQEVIIDGKKSNIFDHQYGQAGASIHVPDEIPSSYVKEVIMGAPGVRSWTGTVTRTLWKSKKKRVYQVPDPSQFRDVFGRTKEFLQFYDYFGYAVSSGRLFIRYEGKQYVGGAPRGASNRGKVLIFRFDDDVSSGKQARVTVIESLDGKQLGEYFGASVLAVDVNNDGVADLLVGAPMHDLSNRTSDGEHGRVYVFMSTGEALEEKASLVGEKIPGARFGTTMSYADINKDGYKDVFIGAPLQGYSATTDKGWGAVYLYHGSENGLKTTPSQIIYPETLSSQPPLQGLGISISKALDVDDNGYEDTAFGAYSSGHAVVLLSRSIVHLEVEVQTNYSNGIPATLGARFEIRVYLQYSGKAVPPNLRLNLNVTLVDAAVFDDNDDQIYEIQTRLEEGKRSLPITKVARITSLGDVTNPIKLNVTSDILPSGRSSADLSPPKPILDETRSVVRPLRWKWDCLHGDYCITDLSTKLEVMDFPGSSGEIEIGAREELNLTITMTNSDKDRSYGTKLIVLLPGRDSGVELKKTTQCTPDDSPSNYTKLSCFLTPVVQVGAVETFNILLDIKKLVATTAEMSFVAELTTKVNDTNEDNNRDKFTMKLHSLVNAAITGYPTPEQISFKRDHKREEKLIGTPNLYSFHHAFRVYKDGPTPLELAFVNLKIPRKWEGIKFLKVIDIRIIGGNDKNKCSYISGRQEQRWINKKERELYQDTRQKREVIANQKKEAFTQEESVATTEQKNSLLLYCNGDSDCVEVKCEIRNIDSRDDSVWINVTMQIDLTTLKDEVRYISEVRVESKGSIHLQKPKNSRRLTDSNVRTDGYVVTNFIPEGPAESRPIPWWVYLLAVLGGILLIAIIVLILIKCGFFKRKKRDEMRSMMHEPVLDTADHAAGVEPSHAPAEPIRLSNAHFMDERSDEDASLIRRTVFPDAPVNGTAQPTDLTAVPEEILTGSVDSHEGSSLIDPISDSTENNVNPRHSTAL